VEQSRGLNVDGDPDERSVGLIALACLPLAHLNTAQNATVVHDRGLELPIGFSIAHVASSLPPRSQLLSRSGSAGHFF
jgi:hypothetical protein